MAVKIAALIITWLLVSLVCAIEDSLFESYNRHGSYGDRHHTRGKGKRRGGNLIIIN